MFTLSNTNPYKLEDHASELAEALEQWLLNDENFSEVYVTIAGIEKTMGGKGVS